MEITLTEAFMEAPIFGKKKYGITRQSFGNLNPERDAESVGLHVRMIGKYENAIQKPEEHVFGIYLGYNEKINKWIVATSNCMSLVPSKLALYDTLDDLKSEWELD